MNQIRDFLETGEFDIVFCWITKNHYADMHEEPPLIRISMPLQICSRFLHEHLHVKYPKKNERQNRLTRKEIMEIVKEVIGIAWTKRWGRRKKIKK